MPPITITDAGINIPRRPKPKNEKTRQFNDYLRYRATRLEEFANPCHEPATGRFCETGTSWAEASKRAIEHIPERDDSNNKFWLNTEGFFVPVGNAHTSVFPEDLDPGDYGGFAKRTRAIRIDVNQISTSVEVWVPTTEDQLSAIITELKRPMLYVQSHDKYGNVHPQTRRNPTREDIEKAIKLANAHVKGLKPSKSSEFLSIDDLEEFVSKASMSGTSLEEFSNPCHSPEDGRFCETEGHPSPLPAGLKYGKRYTHEEMLAAGADGHLSNAILKSIPLSKIDGREPVPASSEGKEYKKGQQITQPIEVIYQPDNDVYTLYAGNHRVHQAEINGQTEIPAFVERERAAATEFYNKCHTPDSGRFCETEAGPAAQSSDEEISKVKIQALEKIANAPTPSRAQVRKGRLQKGSQSLDGNAASRRRQRENLFEEFGGNEKGYVVDHATGVKMHWTTDATLNPNGYPVFERGRIFTQRQGGGYQLQNLIPELHDTNKIRHDRPVRTENLH